MPLTFKGEKKKKLYKKIGIYFLGKGSFLRFVDRASLKLITDVRTIAIKFLKILKIIQINCN